MNRKKAAFVLFTASVFLLSLLVSYLDLRASLSPGFAALGLLVCISALAAFLFMREERGDRLAASIGHDWAQPLQVLTMSSGLIQRKLKDRNELTLEHVRELAELNGRVVESSTRLATLLHDFAQKRKP